MEHAKKYRRPFGGVFRPGLLFSLHMTLLIALILPSPLQAAPGDPDLSFGSAGLVSTDFGGESDDLVTALALQPDGKIVVAGSTDSPSNISHLALARYNADGSLDTAFGSGGRVTTGFATKLGPAIALALQPDDKIMVWTPSTLSRINTDGSLDTTFGSEGKVTTEISAYIIGAHAFGVEPNGKIVLAGTSRSCSPVCSTDFTLARYTADGSLDATFGSGGQVITDIAGGDDVAMVLALQPDGKIVVLGGWSRPPLPGCCSLVADFIGLARYNPDGTFDATFGSGGKVTTGLPFFGITGFPFPLGIALQADGKIVVTSSTLTRFNSDGTLDATLATESGGLALGLQPDGKIVLAGGGKLLSFPCILGFCPTDFTLKRYNSNGIPDLTFGNRGTATTEFPGSVFWASTLARQPDGKIVVAGTITPFSGSANFALARFEGGPLDSAPILGLHLSRRTFNPSDTLRIDVTATNLGPAFDADLYFGALLPDGTTLVFVTKLAPPAFVVADLAGDARSFQAPLANVHMPGGSIGELVSDFQYTFSGMEPSGEYLAFAALVKPGAFQDGRLDSGDILVLALKTFTFSGLTVPTPITPINDAAFKSNDPSGRCWTLFFDWTDSHSFFGIFGYFLVAQHKDAQGDPFLFELVTASELTKGRCTGNTTAAFLNGWEWRVQAIDNLGNSSPWSEPGSFRLER